MLHKRILLGLIIGAALGVTVNAVWGGADPRIEAAVANFTEPVGELFLRLLLMMVIPLVFSSLIVGVSGMGGIRKLGRVGLKCLAYTIVISAISVVIGVGLAISPADPESILDLSGSGLRRSSLEIILGKNRPVAGNLSRQTNRRYPAFADIVAPPFHPPRALEQRTLCVFEPERCSGSLAINAGKCIQPLQTGGQVYAFGQCPQIPQADCGFRFAP